MSIKNQKKFFVFIFLFALFFSFFYSPKESLANIDCLKVNSASSESDKNFCRQELAKIEAELQELLNKQKEQQKQTGTLKGDVSFLNSQINALKTKIKARAIAIAQLRVSITEKASKIATLEEKIENHQESISQLLRNTHQLQNEGLVYLVFSDKTLSSFYGDLDSYDSIKESIKKELNNVRGIKELTEEEKKELESKRDAETDAKEELEVAQKKTAQSEAEKKKLLAISQKQETEYQKLAAEKKARADKIRAVLFSLAGLTTGRGIPFGEALNFANEAKKLTGIEPAFLLAIFKQESNLGSNVGRCFLTDTEGPKAGYGINPTTGKIWSNLMKPSRDIKPFLEITSHLGLDPLKTNVSCPIAGVAGYGGAMGPAQFIPSTWKIFEERLRDLLGRYASPWEPQDAFMASAMYLTDLGAVGTSASAQHKAACRYYGSGGSTCTYSRSVMKLKQSIQNDIDLLSN